MKKTLICFVLICMAMIHIIAAEPSGVPNDLEKYQTQAERYSRAYYLYRHTYYEAAYPLFKALAEENYIPAQYDAGICLIKGDGVKKDVNKGLSWLKKAAGHGNSDAQLYIGYVYLNGEGVKKNYKEAARWFRRCAEQGNASGQYYTGYCHEKGYGVQRDLDAAIMWYRKALSGGEAKARKALSRLIEEQRSFRNL